VDILNHRAPSSSLISRSFKTTWRWGYLGSIQRAGSDAIGIIVTRDGCVRFWSVLRRFSVLVQGNGVKRMEEHVYQVALP
jgi:hypothetical protein